MALLTWSAQYSVGVSAFDEEHKQLMTFINELHDAMKAGRGREVVGGTLDRLIGYTKSHFAHEERLFAQTGYPMAAGHKRAHDELTERVMEIHRKYMSGKTMALSVEVMNFLKAWLVEHIEGTDQQYAPHLNSMGVH